MFLVKVFSAVLAVSSVHALPTFVKSSIFEKISTPPPGWELDETVKLDKDASVMKLRLHLVQQNKDKFYELATNVSFVIPTPCTI